MARCQICGRRRRRSEGPGKVCEQCARDGGSSGEVLRRKDSRKQSAPLPKAGISKRLPPLPAPIKKKRVTFQCVYCPKKLKIPVVKKRTKVRCPSCSEDFYLYPDGRREAIPDTSVLPVAEPVSSPMPRFPDPEQAIQEPPKRSGRSSRRSKRRSAELRTGDIARKRSARQRTASGRNAFESAEYDPSVTGFNFETVTGLEGSNLQDLRDAAGLGDDDDGYRILDESSEGSAPLRSRKKRHRKKRRKKTEQGFVILAASEEVARKKKARKKKARSTSAHAQKMVAIPVEDKRGKKRRRGSTRRTRVRRSSTRMMVQELSGEVMRTPGALSPVSIALYLILMCVPPLVTLLFLSSTTRDRGFASQGTLGQRLERLGDAVQRAAQELGKATGGR